jgi:hypothetical protein
MKLCPTYLVVRLKGLVKVGIRGAEVLVRGVQGPALHVDFGLGLRPHVDGVGCVRRTVKCQSATRPLSANTMKKDGKRIKQYLENGISNMYTTTSLI